MPLFLVDAGVLFFLYFFCLFLFPSTYGFYTSTNTPQHPVAISSDFCTRNTVNMLKCVEGPFEDFVIFLTKTDCR